ncbi:MAG: hypothetical protein HPY50_16845 [Firmicutes bacterium]|nr:hypothetical protein [Bacillota bacterium]
MRDLITTTNQIPLEKIIQIYTRSEISEEGSYQKVDPCPKCGHDGCCKINTEDNSLVCFGQCGIKYHKPIKTVQWLFGLDAKEAILKLAGDFKILIPEGFEEDYQEYLQRRRREQIFTRFAEECHKLLTPEDREYWRSRGFTDDTINRYLIGVCTSYGCVAKQLMGEFSDAELLGTGLFTAPWREYFVIHHNGRAYPHYTLPNWYNGRVIDIQGRFRGEDYKEQGLGKYKTIPGTVGHPYNPAALKEKVVYLAEGIPDILSLLQMGFNALGSYGARGFKDEWIPGLKEKETVYIIYDNDETGITSARNLALKIGDHARIITIQDAKDVNELLAKHGTDEARQIVEELTRSAKTALQLEIESLPGDLGSVSTDQIKSVARGIQDLPPHRSRYYQQYLAQHLKTDKKTIEETVKYYRGNADAQGKKETGQHDEVKSRIILEADPQLVRVPQCFAGGKACYAQGVREVVDYGDLSYTRFTAKLITSDREIIDLPSPISEDPLELISWVVNGTELLLKRPLETAPRRWSKTGNPYSIDVFLKGEEKKVNTPDLYRAIEAVFRRHYYTTEDYDYVILALFTMMGYYYDLHDAVPYIYLNGQPDTGKTTICILLQHMGFNAELVSNISTASLYREAEQKQMTLILDEQEGITSRRATDEKPDYAAILKDGYKRTGTIKRQDPKNPGVTQEFEVYSPIVIANVMGIDDIIGSRAIPITTKAAPREVIASIQKARPSDPKFRNETALIRDMLYCWVMQNHEYLRELPKMDVGDTVINRAGELFQPILALATYIDHEDKTRELKLLERLNQGLPSKEYKREVIKSKDTRELLREACLLALADQKAAEKGKAAWVSVNTIFDRLVEVNGQRMPYMTVAWIGKEIQMAGWIKSKKDRDRKEIMEPKRNETTNLIIDGSATVKKRVTVYYLRHDLLKG